MIRIALYDKNAEEARNLRRILGTYAERQRIFNVSISIGNSLESFVEALKQKEPGYFNVALIRVSEVGDAVLDKLSNLLACMDEITSRTEVVVLSNDPRHAYNAYEVGVRFLRMPFDEHGFSATIGKSLQHTVAVNKRPFPVKSGKTVVVTNLNDIMFAETSKRGPIIHLPESRTIPMKGTLQALYDRLHDVGEQFFRAGGSLIVNLDNIRSTDSNSVIFATGETIVLPVRARKAVSEAFADWKTRTS